MKELKINFIDFWPNFEKENNYFYNILSKKYKLIISDQPDIIIYSCFGQDYLNYSCKRVFYTGENIKPNFYACDFAFSFEFNKNEKQYRLPLYIMYLDDVEMLKKIEYPTSLSDLKKKWEQKSKFLCMVVSNPNSKFRLNFFQNFSKLRKIDSGGKIFNNVGGRVANKLDFIKEYKFVMAFENSSSLGYTTEKILEPLFVDSIPIYWGNKDIDIDFNPKRFINYNDFNSEKELNDYLTEIENDVEKALAILRQPWFSDKRPSYENEKVIVLDIFTSIIESNKKPVAISIYKYFNYIQLLILKILNKLKKIIFKYFFKIKKT